MHVHPSRLDINNVYDLYEEAMKVIDINELKPAPISFDILSFNNSSSLSASIHAPLLSHGFFEVKTYNLTAAKEASMYDYLNL